MKKRILLPTDFSKNATKAINYALQLYKDIECEFYLLHAFRSSGNIVDDLLNMEPGSSIYESTKEASQNELNRVLDTLLFNKEGNTKHDFKTISTYNHPVEAIKNIVEKKDIQMIIMGTKGEGDSGSIFGSTAIYVMEKVRNCPVIVVPDDANNELPKEIVFPTGYDLNYKIQELNNLFEIAKRFDAHIAVLHVLEDEKLDDDQLEQKAMLEEYLKELNHSFHEINHDSVVSAVNLFVESRDSSLVAFINKKHRFFGSIFTQPLVKNITFHSKVPIMVMHDLKN